MPAARKTKPAVMTKQQIVDRLCGMDIGDVEEIEANLAKLRHLFGSYSSSVDEEARIARRIAAMLVKA